MVGMRDDDDLLWSGGSGFFLLSFDVANLSFSQPDESGLGASIGGWLRDAVLDRLACGSGASLASQIHIVDSSVRPILIPRSYEYLADLAL